MRKAGSGFPNVNALAREAVMDGEQRPDAEIHTRDIVVISADPEFRRSMAQTLRRAGFSCRTVDSLAGVLDVICISSPALAIVEGCFGPWRAANFCLELGKHAALPLIAIDQSSDVLDSVLALEMGADHYVAHPVNEREMLARIKALLRRSGAPAPRLPGGVGSQPKTWCLELAPRRLSGPGGGKVRLTAADQRLLLDLVQQAGDPIRIQSGCGSLSEGGAPGPVRVAIRRLRRKLESVGFPTDTILNMRQQGYAFDADIAGQGVIMEPRRSPASRLIHDQ